MTPRRNRLPQSAPSSAPTIKVRCNIGPLATRQPPIAVHVRGRLEVAIHLARLPADFPPLYRQSVALTAPIQAICKRSSDRPYPPNDDTRRCAMALQIGDTAPDFEAQTTEGKIRFHDWLGELVGRAVLASEGLHAGVHHRARLHGADQAGVRQARRQDHRPLGRSGREPCEVGERHQGDARLRAELSDDRRHRSLDLEGLGHAAGELRTATLPSAPRWTIRPCATCSSSAPTRRSS